jgi:single-stranded-DNA-specific exonuclease
MTPSQWRLRPFDADLVQAIARASGLPPLVAQLLVHRGVTNANEARAYLEVRRDGLHDPELLPGAAEAADRIVRAVRERRKIVIYGDYDVDGVCGTAILWACLRLAGATDVGYYIPKRIDEGYGVNSDALRHLATEMQASLIVTVDCGVTACEQARLARELGVELVITDHHTPGPDWPDADALVHPRGPGSLYPFGDLCGAGVAFKLAWQVCKSFGDGKKASPQLRDFLMRSINLVALATVADVVPLEDENRIFVRHGLRGLTSDPSVGLQALMQVSGCIGQKRLSTGTIGFGLAPRINAAGRLSCAALAVEMLTTDDAERAIELAKELDECNRQRQEVERAMVDEAHAMISASGGLGDRGGIVLGKAGWHPGVIGIVAGRIAETYHRPTVIVALGDTIGQGSARSVAGYDLYSALAACADGLASFGGHKAAAGLKVHPDHFPAFAERFERHCSETLPPELRRKVHQIDAEVHLGELTPRVVEAIESLEPYGIGNPRPLLMSSDVRVVGDPRVVGDKKNHLQLKFAQGNAVVKAIYWNGAGKAPDLAAGAKLAVAFEPNINEWNGRREVQLVVKDVQLAAESAQVVPA